MTNPSFWRKKWNGQLCGITHGRLRPGMNKQGMPYSIFLECKHGFYLSVIMEWAKKCYPENPTCPVCRKVFGVK
jgi:hypothetical protein